MLLLPFFVNVNVVLLQLTCACHLSQVADDISRRCRIMEPLNPTYGTCVRRLALDQACSVTVSINPLNPTAVSATIKLMCCIRCDAVYIRISCVT